MVFLRRAPVRDAEVLNVLVAGMELEMDSMRCGWVRTAQQVAPMTGGPKQRGWALVDGKEVGLGLLLQRLR